MKKVEILVTEESSNGIQAVAVYEGKVIDSHFHSSEYWLLFDWGFFDHDAMDGQKQDYSHDKELKEKVGEDFELIYKDKKRLIKVSQ